MNIYDKSEVGQEVIRKLKGIKDLELPINIYDLGLIYKTNVEYNSDCVDVNIEMTVINSRCNSTKSFIDKIVSDIKSIDEVDNCSVKFVFSPKWQVTMISPDGLEQLRNSGNN